MWLAVRWPSSPKIRLGAQDWHQWRIDVRSSVGDDLEIWVNLLQILEFVKQLASCDPKQIKTRPGEYWTQYDDSNCFWWCAGLHSQCKVNSLTWEQNNSFTISIHFILIRLAACGWTCLGVPLNSKCKRFLSKLRSWDDGHFGYRPNVAGIMTVQKDSGGWDLSTQSSDLKTRVMTSLSSSLSLLKLLKLKLKSSSKWSKGALCSCYLYESQLVG